VAVYSAIIRYFFENGWDQNVLIFLLDMVEAVVAEEF